MTAFQALQLALQALLTLGGAFLAAWLAARFTLDRFYKEKTWERKAAAYTTIFESLEDMWEWYDVHWEAEMVKRDLGEARRSELQASYKAARATLRRRVAGESWLLDPEVQITVAKCLDALEHARDSWFDHLDTGLAELDKAIKKLGPIARRELGVQSPQPAKKIID